MGSVEENTIITASRPGVQLLQLQGLSIITVVAVFAVHGLPVVAGMQSAGGY